MAVERLDPEIIGIVVHLVPKEAECLVEQYIKNPLKTVKGKIFHLRFNENTYDDTQI